MEKGLQNLRVVSFQNRRSEEMGHLIEKRGGTIIQAPSMREVPLEDQHHAFEFADILLGGNLDGIILLTGVGTRMLVEAMCLQHPHEAIHSALQDLPKLCRGPKPVAYLKTVSMKPTLVAPEPNTWRELIAEFDRVDYPLQGKKIAIQEYGHSNPDLEEALRQRGVEIIPIPVYGWKLPEDTSLLESALKTIAAGNADIALFTSAQQVQNVFEVAKAMDSYDDIHRELNQMLVASVGPITTEALEKFHVAVKLEPEHPKMGHLIKCLSENATRLLDEA